MKRSEMVELLREEMVDKLNDYFSPTEASQILLFLETKGMLPPAYYDRYYDDEPECDGMINEWEPEELDVNKFMDDNKDLMNDLAELEEREKREK